MDREVCMMDHHRHGLVGRLSEPLMVVLGDERAKCPRCGSFMIKEGEGHRCPCCGYKESS